ncbi:28S ribosomal protein S24, mitochondrial [Thrips palmi]|uniref:28S ribosomal protein S24, mitochondrial n=1 Tax=Thrips palmi TaxID=161013 RepID=A0A6P8ZX90_THRPL|nr:28S ribosomal protein S24, mitochondrial [Thrips palmi]
MAYNFSQNIWKNALLSSNHGAWALHRTISTTPVRNRVSVGRYKPLEGRKQLLTYDQAIKPHELAHKKSWNTWNTSTLEGGRRSQLTTIEDMFIRRFIHGAWFCHIKGQQIIIKRQHNIIRIAFCLPKKLPPQSVYFITGFCERLLSIWLHCPVKLEIQAVENYEGYVKIV